MVLAESGTSHSVPRSRQAGLWGQAFRPIPHETGALYSGVRLWNNLRALINGKPMDITPSPSPDPLLYPQGTPHAAPALAQALPGQTVERRPRQRSSARSWISVFLLLVSLVLIATAIYEKLSVSKVIIGTKDEVRYSGTATKEQALALGQAFKTAGYFSNRGVTVLLDKGASGAIISFVVQPAGWTEWGKVAAFEQIGRDMASTVGGLPLKVRLVDDDVHMKREMDVHANVQAGGIEMRYSGSATEAQAKALAEAFHKGVPGKKMTVLFSVNQGRKEIAMVVHPGTWDDAGAVLGLQAFVRSVADSVGGLPITLRLIDSSFNSKKEAPVQ